MIANRISMLESKEMNMNVVDFWTLFAYLAAIAAAVIAIFPPKGLP